MGLRWCDVDLDARQIMITQSTTESGSEIVTGPPKSAASRRTIAIDKHTVAILRAHAERQRFERRAAGYDWVDTGHVFTRIDGTQLRPSTVTYRFRKLWKDVGLPPVRLHDLRHGAASLAHCAGADLKTIQDQLGHASIVLTADTYTSVLPPAQHDAAAATALLVLDAARRLRGDVTAANRRRRARVNARKRRLGESAKPQVTASQRLTRPQATCRKKRATGEQAVSA
ncbi:site-specific integrase [Cryptosporangium sp. NPDC051539]|uniref:site-specific integrase n=1 Tax=Cryptosporangium sp. NPDC051539 TaxID=3363962 RepID=UPI003797C4D8